MKQMTKLRHVIRQETPQTLVVKTTDHEEASILVFKHRLIMLNVNVIEEMCSIVKFIPEMKIET